MNTNHWRRKTAYMGLFLALALICSYIEALIPFHFGIPGIKLGLTNIVVVLVLYCVGPWEAIIISVFRILLSGFMFGNAFGIIYSLAGGVLSFMVMLLLKQLLKLHCFSVSVAGGISHNIGQLIVAYFIVGNINIFYYIAVLLISGAITGALIGLLSQEIVIRIGNKLRF